jgi:hypothetical protein
VDRRPLLGPVAEPRPRAPRRREPLRERPVTRAVAATAVLLGVAAWPLCCLDDLPPPTVCPPEAAHEAKDCLTPLEPVYAVPPQPFGCLTQDQQQCLTGRRSSCTCQLDDCPSGEEAACYPEGNCPPAVIDEAGADAECIRLDPRDLGVGLPSEAQCLCGCFGCAAVCDGVGPVFGIWTDGTLEYGFPQIDIGPHMPSSGRLGVYVRLRGLANAALAVFTDDGVAPAPDLATYYYVLSPIDTEFRELIFYDQTFFEVPAYEWETEAMKPTLLALIPGGTTDAPGLTLVEIDCVVPFVVR